jgi:hypothetical protein
MDVETVHAEREELGPPLTSGWLCVPSGTAPTRRDPGDGRLVEIAIWSAPSTPMEPHVWRAWLFIEGHAEFDPPRRVLGATPLQCLLIAFSVIDRFAE